MELFQEVKNNPKIKNIKLLGRNRAIDERRLSKKKKMGEGTLKSYVITSVENKLHQVLDFEEKCGEKDAKSVECHRTCLRDSSRERQRQCAKCARFNI